MDSCPKCTGLLVMNDEEIRCVNCGYVSYNAPTIPLRSTREQPTKRKKISTPPIAWLHQNAETLGTSCILAVYRILDRLDAPFMRIFKERKPFAKIRLPCFYFDPTYQRETGRIVGYRNSDTWKKLMGKGEELARMIDHLPQRQRNAAGRILWLCDERMREKVLLTDCRIRWFLGTIEHEQVRLNTLQQALDQPSLFSFSSADTLLRYRENTQGQLDRARGIIKEACGCLEPAMNFYCNERSPTRHDAKKALLEIFQTAPFHTKRKAAALVSSLLTLADPQRPTKRESLRTLSYRPPRRSQKTIR